MKGPVAIQRTKKESIKHRIQLLSSLLLEYGLFSIYRLLRDNLLTYLKYGIIGSTIRIEASSVCQLKCPKCTVADGKRGIIGSGYLRFNDFKEFIDAHPMIRNVELSNHGEMFLNPELENIVKYASKKKINLTALNGVNLNTVSERMLEYLVKYKFKAIVVSVDGATQEIYEIYRRGGHFNTVIQNIKKINFYKQKYQRKFPILVWQFVIFGHNEHELPLAKKMAEELNMGFVIRLNWSPSYSPVKNKENVRREIGYGSRKEYERKFHRVYMPLCYQLWDSPQVNWDGKLLGCCVNRSSDFGNVFKSGLEKCLKSEKYVYAKKMLLGKEKPRKDIPCLSCAHYKRINPQKMNPVRGYILRLIDVVKSV